MSSRDIYASKTEKEILQLVKQTKRRKLEADERNEEGTACLYIQNNKYLVGDDDDGRKEFEESGPSTSQPKRKIKSKHKVPRIMPEENGKARGYSLYYFIFQRYGPPDLNLPVNI